MLRELEFSSVNVQRYHRAVEKYQLSPSEYLVWHGLVVACSYSGERTDYLCYAVSVAEVSRAIKIQRETVRRALWNLQEKGLAKRINDRWMFLSSDE